MIGIVPGAMFPCIVDSTYTVDTIVAIAATRNVEIRRLRNRGFMVDYNGAAVRAPRTKKLDLKAENHVVCLRAKGRKPQLVKIK